MSVHIFLCLSVCLFFPVVFSVSVYKVSVGMPLMCVGKCLGGSLIYKCGSIILYFFGNDAVSWILWPCVLFS